MFDYPSLIFAQTITWLILSRALSSIGGGGIVSSVWTITSENGVDRSRRDGRIVTGHLLSPAFSESKAVSVKVPRVVGPRPPHSQCVSHARRELNLAASKVVHPLPVRLTHFEDNEDELLAAFRPPSTISSPLRFSRDNYDGTPVRSDVHFWTQSHPGYRG